MDGGAFRGWVKEDFARRVHVFTYVLRFSERIGWIPEADDVPHSLVQDYRWIFGLSVTEMEIVHGAYRKDNPNCT